jgi:hypothetical protein
MDLSIRGFVPATSRAGAFEGALWAWERCASPVGCGSSRWEGLRTGVRSSFARGSWGARTGPTLLRWTGARGDRSRGAP